MVLSALLHVFYHGACVCDILNKAAVVIRLLQHLNTLNSKGTALNDLCSCERVVIYFPANLEIFLFISQPHSGDKVVFMMSCCRCNKYVSGFPVLTFDSR